MAENDHPRTPPSPGAAAAVAERAPAAAASRSPFARIRTFKSLEHREFRLLWLGIIGTSTSQWMEQVLLGWLGYELTGSALALALGNAFRAGPALLSAPLGGVAADRMDRKKLMMLSQFILLAAAAALGLLLVLGHLQIEHLYLFAFVTGVGWSFNQPVRQSLLPNLVPRADFNNAIALQSSAFQITRLVGPSLAGMLIASFGSASVLFVEIWLFLAVLWGTQQMHIPPLPGKPKKEPVFDTLKAGFSYIRNYKELFSVMLMALIPQLFAMPYFTVLPVFAKEVLGVGPVGFGVLATMPGVGAVVATLTVATIGDFRNKGRVLVIAAIGQGATIILLAAASLAPREPFLWDWVSPAFLLCAAMLVFVGGCVMTYNTLSNTLVQTLSSDEMRGRVASVYMFNQGIQPLGTTWAGFMASLPFMDVTGAYLVMGITTIVMAASLNFKFPTVRRL